MALERGLYLKDSITFSLQKARKRHGAMPDAGLG
jgi:hypothetical protein